jgi:hypothetical protein
MQLSRYSPTFLPGSPGRWVQSRNMFPVRLLREHLIQGAFVLRAPNYYHTFVGTCQGFSVGFLGDMLSNLIEECLAFPVPRLHPWWIGHIRACSLLTDAKESITPLSREVKGFGDEFQKSVKISLNSLLPPAPSSRNPLAYTGTDEQPLGKRYCLLYEQTTGQE